MIMFLDELGVCSYVLLTGVQMYKLLKIVHHNYRL